MSGDGIGWERIAGRDDGSVIWFVCRYYLCSRVVGGYISFTIAAGGDGMAIVRVV